MTLARRVRRRLAAGLAVACLGLTGCVVTTEVEPPAPEQDGGSPTSGTSGEGYTFLHTRGDGEPVRWNSCGPIRYVVRPDGAPDGADRLLEESVARIAEVTGLELVDAGTTDEAPAQDRSPYQPDRYGADRWAPVLVAYATPEEYPALEGRAAGFGGAVAVRPGGAPPRYVSGIAVFDVEQLEEYGSEDAVRAVMLHELAHVVGLGHVDDRSQLMNPVQYGRQVTTLQDGDLAGLEVLGEGECLDPVDPSRVRAR